MCMMSIATYVFALMVCNLFNILLHSYVGISCAHRGRGGTCAWWWGYVYRFTNVQGWVDVARQLASVGDCGFILGASNGTVE